MIGCDSRPGYPPDRTVRGDRRSRDSFRPASARAAEAADRCRAGVPGGGAGAAGRPVGASLAAAVLRAARAPVSLPAASAGLSQAAQGRRAAAGRGAGPPGPAVPVVVRPCAADRCDPRAVRRLAGDCQAQRPGRVGCLRVLRRAFALVLGPEAIPGHHRARAAPGPPGPQGRGAPARAIGWIRQWIESVNDTLKGQLDLERHGGRTAEGVYARIAQRLLAMAVCIWHNWATAEPVKRR